MKNILAARRGGDLPCFCHHFCEKAKIPPKDLEEISLFITNVWPRWGQNGIHALCFYKDVTSLRRVTICNKEKQIQHDPARGGSNICRTTNPIWPQRGHIFCRTTNPTWPQRGHIFVAKSNDSNQTPPEAGHTFVAKNNKSNMTPPKADHGFKGMLGVIPNISKKWYPYNTCCILYL